MMSVCYISGFIDRLLTGWAEGGRCRSEFRGCDIIQPTGSGHHGGRGSMQLSELNQSSVGDQDQEDPGGGRGTAEEDSEGWGHRQVRLRLLILGEVL